MQTALHDFEWRWPFWPQSFTYPSKQFGSYYSILACSTLRLRQTPASKTLVSSLLRPAPHVYRTYNRITTHVPHYPALFPRICLIAHQFAIEHEPTHPSTITSHNHASLLGTNTLYLPIIRHIFPRTFTKPHIKSSQFRLHPQFLRTRHRSLIVHKKFSDRSIHYGNRDCPLQLLRDPLRQVGRRDRGWPETEHPLI